MNSDFEIDVGSDPNYEDLVADISYKGTFLALLSQEEGFESLDVEIHTREDGRPWRFKLMQLEEAIAKAKQKLWELRRIV